MKGNMEERACALAAYIIENRATVRAAAKKFGVSKSTVHKDLPPAAVQPQPILAGQGGTGGQQGPAPHPRRHGHAKKIQGILKLFSTFCV